MSNELNIFTGVTGQTVVATPYLLNVAQSPISMSELGTTGVYSGNMTGSAGIYEVVFSVDDVSKGAGEIIWDGTAEINVKTISAEIKLIPDSILDEIV